MKKLLNKLSNNQKLEEDSLRADSTYSDEENIDNHVRKTVALPAEPRDTPQDFKLKKSFSGNGSIGREDFSRKKSHPSGIKVHKDKENNDKEKLNESVDKALRKSGSKKGSIKKNNEDKNSDSMKSPSLKNIFVSSYEHQNDSKLDGDDGSSSEDDLVPRSPKSTMVHPDDDEFYSTTPIRVPSAPACLATSPAVRAVTPRMDSPHSFTASPPRNVASPRFDSPSLTLSPSIHAASPRLDSPPRALSPPASPFQPGLLSPAREPALSRSMSSPPPPAQQKPPVVDDFDLRFGEGRERAESISDETALGADFQKSRIDSVNDDVEMIDEQITNQKGKSGGLFSRNKAKKLK